MQRNIVENINSIIKETKGMLIIGFVDKNNIVDYLISEKIKLVADTLNFKLDIYEFDAELVENNYNYLNCYNTHV